VVGVGLACLDQLLIWEDTAAPVEGNKITRSDMQGGGMAATAMVAVSRLGGQSELWSAVGDDWVGEQIVRLMEVEGVDIGQVERIEGGKSLLMVVSVDGKTGERHFTKASERDKPQSEVGNLARLTDAGCLLIDHVLPESEIRAHRPIR
jgi:sulfofructose kinase